jgi:hypothetical protein
MAKQHIPGHWLSRGRCQSTPADLRPEHPLARLVGALGLLRGLPGSCHETVTSVKPPYRTRSQSRISSLAALARRIADDRALKAPGQSYSVARVLAMPRGFPRPRFTIRV